jgi:signal transduction histidine kinase
MLVPSGLPMPALFRNAEVLLVDDEPANLILLQKILKAAGYARIRSTTEPRNVLSLFSDVEPDIILLDLKMPNLDGFGVLELLKETIPAGAFLPVLVLTADATSKTKLRALSSGAHDFLTKPFDPAEVVQRVGNLLDTRRLQRQVQEQNRNLETIVAERTAELEAALKQLKETQQQIVQQERLHAFGTMASGVAHDFNNALTTILGFGEVALRECEDSPGVEGMQNYLQTIITAARDGAKMVTRLREFYRPNDSAEPRVAVDVNELIKQSITITQPKWKSQPLVNGVNIDIVTDFGKLPRILGDAAELRDMLTNLIFNAVDAMPNGGRISLRTSAKDRHARIEVQDTGTGMTEEVRRRCLEPFFSTKGERGTGLGLAMVYGIIERHGGVLDVQSALGVGTTFVITLPQKESVAEIVKDSALQIDRPLHVLVVDDQAAICTLLTEYLKNDCHTVVTAADGAEALQKFAEAQFDLVITDQGMPGITGEQVADAIKARRSSTPVILLTGFGEICDDAWTQAVDCIVSKPISLIEFRHAVVRAITNATDAATPPAGELLNYPFSPRTIEHADARMS